MQRPAGFLLLLAVVSLCLGPVAFAQTSPNQTNAGDVAQQFKSGANRVGNGAAQMGEGVKQGAILTWQAVQDGAAAVAARFNGSEPANLQTQKSQ